MNKILTVIAALVVAATVGVVTHGLSNYSGIAYVLLLICDLVVFSAFCTKNKAVLIKPYAFFVGVNAIISLYFLMRM